MEIKVKKAKISKGGRVEASYTDVDGNEITLKGKNVCHNDLKVATAKLIPYFADLTEQKESDFINWKDLDSVENIDLLRKIEVTGVSIGGDDMNPIVTLTGKRTLNTSKVLNINTPGVELNSETLDWIHIDDFDVAVQGFFYEVGLYITDRKWQVVQSEINFDVDPIEESFAFVKLMEKGKSLEDIAVRFGKSIRFVQDRIKLNTLNTRVDGGG